MDTASSTLFAIKVAALILAVLFIVVKTIKARSSVKSQYRQHRSVNEVPAHLRTHQNAQILKFLEPLSCHSDIAEPLVGVLREYPDVQFYCGNREEFHSACWYVNDTVFAFAEGMHSVHLRLPTADQKQARLQGGVSNTKAGSGWTGFKYNHSDLSIWVEKAYSYAKSTK